MPSCSACGRSGPFVVRDREGVCLQCGEIAMTGDVDGVLRDLEQPVLARKRTVLGRRYLIQRSRLPWLVGRPLEIRRWDSAWWVYPHSTRISYWGIPLWKSWSVVVEFPAATVRVPAAGESDAIEIMECAVGLAPWAHVGATHENVRAVFVDRASVIAQAAARAKAARAVPDAADARPGPDAGVPPV